MKNKYYTENSFEWKNAALKDYYINVPVKAITIENGYILPVKFEEGIYKGGVLDANKNFIAGHEQRLDGGGGAFRVQQAYNIENEVTYLKQTVVFAGVIMPHYGHFIIESLSRMWWYLENRACGYKYVFIILGELNSAFKDFILLLGINEDEMIFLEKPMQFSCVIVPDQTTMIQSGFKNGAVSIYNKIRNHPPPPLQIFTKIYILREELEAAIKK